MFSKIFNRNVLLCAIVVFFLRVYARPVDIQMVRSAAEMQIEMCSVMDADLNNYLISKIDTLYNIWNDGQILGYIAELSPKGYVALSSDSDIRPVIAYSFDSNFDFTNDEGNILYYMLCGDLDLRMSAVQKFSPSKIEENNRLWLKYCSKSADLLDSVIVYGPWLDTKWGQGNPYNRYCPIDPSTGERCVTGCSNTAMAQIINYWEYPSSVEFFPFESYWSYATDPPIWIDAPSASIDTIEYNTEYGVHPTSDMIARLMWACGVTLEAQYSSFGTGAFFEADDYLSKWGYLSAEDIDGYDPNFYDYLQNDMINAMPSQFGIYHDDWSGGHSIVCDGYKTSGEYHLNFGWTGAVDGWYFLPDGMPMGYSIISFAIIHIAAPPRPDSPDDCSEAVLLSVSDEEKWLSDAISPSDDVDWFKFYASPESAYIFYTMGTYDTYGKIFSSCGAEPIMEDDSSQNEKNFRIEFVPDSWGFYYLEVSGLSSLPVGNYVLRYYRAKKSYIQITSPNGGEHLSELRIFPVMWEKGGVPYIQDVKIEYSFDGADGPWNTIIPSTSNTWFFFWQVPDVDGTQNNCYVKVSSVADTTMYDISDSAFYIVESSLQEYDGKPKNLSVKIFPNPFNSSCQITIEQGTAPPHSPAMIEIYDLRGRIVQQLSLSLAKDKKFIRQIVWTPDESVLSGIYFVRLKLDDGSTIVKSAVYLK